MDIAYLFATYLENAGFGVLNTDIFAGQLPSDQSGLYVYRAGGQMHMYLPIEEAIVDIYTVNTQASEAITTLENIKRYIHRMHNTSIGEAYVYTFLVLGDIEDVDRDLEYRKIFKLSVQVKHRDTELIS